MSGREEKGASPLSLGENALGVNLILSGSDGAPFVKKVRYNTLPPSGLPRHMCSTVRRALPSLPLSLSLFLSAKTSLNLNFFSFLPRRQKRKLSESAE